jgi:hypothetical protein
LFLFELGAGVESASSGEDDDLLALVQDVGGLSEGARR